MNMIRRCEIDSNSLVRKKAYIQTRKSGAYHAIKRRYMTGGIWEMNPFLRIHTNFKFLTGHISEIYDFNLLIN